MQITIMVKNAQLVAKGLANIRAEIPRIAESTIKAAAEKVIKRMRVYPPKREGQTYVRTGRLGNSFKVTRSATGYTISNNAEAKGRPYSRYVIGDSAGAIGGSGQAWMHVGRWLLLRDVVEYEVTQLPPMVEEKIRFKVRQAGLA